MDIMIMVLEGLLDVQYLDMGVSGRVSVLELQGVIDPLNK